MKENGFESINNQNESNPPKLVILEKEPKKLVTKMSPEERENFEIEKRKSNEIATAICEKYKKGDVFDFHLEKRHNLYSIILEGSQVGMLGIRDNGDTKQVMIVEINDALKNKGFGKQLYIKLNEYFKEKDGSVLTTDEMKVSPSAVNLWAALERDGLVEELPERAIDGHVLYKFKSE